MFNFHKPKIYRSISGCCICRAKSSSSRFTDSTKYEPEFEKCFRIIEKRSGEICNACVLLVKRWKKLPTGTIRNWQHVVDARAGPGTKSFKNKNPHVLRNDCSKKERKIRKDMRSLTSSDDESEDDEDVADEENEDGLDESLDCNDLADESPGSLRRSTRLAKSGDGSLSLSHKRGSSGRKSIPKKLSEQPLYSFIDPTFWQREEVCCGIIFKGPNNSILMMAPKMFTPCRQRHMLKQKQQQQKLDQAKPGIENKIFMMPEKSLRHQDSFTTNTSTDSLLSDSTNGHGHDELDDRSSGISSMAMCEDLDRLSTVSSSLMDVDDGNSSSASDVFEHHALELGVGVKKASDVSPIPTLSAQAVI